MELSILRNNKQRDQYIDKLREKNLPLKVACQSIYPGRSVDANDYLWGVVYDIIAEETGQDKESVHEGYKRRFNFKRDFIYNRKKNQYEIVTKTQSTTKMDSLEFWEYIMKVRADAEIEIGQPIPMPNEEFTTELNFEENGK